jgi:hypothetical protein
VAVLDALGVAVASGKTALARQATALLALRVQARAPLVTVAAARIRPGVVDGAAPERIRIVTVLATAIVSDAD